MTTPSAGSCGEKPAFPNMTGGVVRRSSGKRQPRVPEGMEVGAHLASPAVPLLDLGKKLSVPQDLMMEELSLRNNRGSLLFQKRQRRVQKFIFEFAASQQAVSKPPLCLQGN